MALNMASIACSEEKMETTRCAKGETLTLMASRRRSVSSHSRAVFSMMGTTHESW